MSSVIDRIDTRIIQAEIQNDPARWEALESFIGTWPRVWLSVLIGGLFSGALYWWLGGWWCRVRLRWCGAQSPDKHHARLLFAYSSFVFAGPAVLVLAGQTLWYPSYLVAYESELVFSSIVLLMFFWSMFTTYKGALTLFSVSPRRAQLWFIALPAVLFFLLMGGSALLYLAVT